MMSALTYEYREVTRRLADLAGQTLSAVTSGQLDLADKLQAETGVLWDRLEQLYAKIRAEHDKKTSI
jgi:hypothetical protein